MAARKIDPRYSFRFTAADIRATYGSAEAAFARGDFMNAAQMAEPGSELKGCSLVLGGLPEQGMAILNAQAERGGRAGLCRAFAFWSLNDMAGALAALAEVRDPALKPAADKFRALLGRDNINVFVTGAILSLFPEHYSESFVAPVYKYGAITVKYVASQFATNAYDYQPTEPMDVFIDSLPAEEKPDILFALSPQWLLAKNFHKVTVPKVLWAHDSDAFQYRNADNFALYDVAICMCSQEHFELGQTTPGLFCAANLLLHPLATPFPEASPHREKTFDIIFTGSALAPFHSEKPRFLFNLAELGAKYTVRVIEGHLPEKDYFALISRAKFVPVVNRYAGMPSPRWRDSLASGSYLLYPEGTFYGEVSPGCFSFNAESMVADIGEHLEKFAAGTDAAYDLAKVVPEINARFAIHRQPREESYLRLLKYALFIGLVWPRPETVAERHQRRLVWLTPAIDCGLFGTVHVRNQINRIGANICVDDLADDIDFNNAAHLHAQMVFIFYESSDVKKWTSLTDSYFEQGLSRFPDSLLLRFNDAHWRFFRPDADILDAAARFQRIIDHIDDFSFNVSGSDVAFAYTLYEQDAVFPCYEYADVATSEMVLQETPQLRSTKAPEHDTRRIILSACHGYIGWALLKKGKQTAALAQLKQAITVYPEGLPVLRLYFDTLLQSFLDTAKPTAKEAADLADAFFAVVNVNPSILLTHIFAVAPLLADNGEPEAAKEALAGWYRLANIVHSLRPDDEKLQRARMDILWNYRELLPSELIHRTKTALRDEPPEIELSQLEARLVKAAKRSAAGGQPDDFKRRTVSRSELAIVLAGAGPTQGQMTFAQIRRGISHWLQAPSGVKMLYFKKAYSMAMRGEIKATLLRVQQWSTMSKWSKGAALSAPPGNHWRKRIAELVARLTGRRRS
jgi:hypothetical protein